MQSRAIFPPLAGALLLASACAEDVEPAAATAAEAAGNPPGDFLPPAPGAADCPAGGRLSAALYGALEGEIDWQADDMSCEGMPRPAGAGARLHFAGTAGDGGLSLAIIVAIPGLARDTGGTDLASNVTIIEEGKGRFFSANDLDNCWADVATPEGVPGSATVTRVSATVSCIAPLAEANGASSVSVERLTFSGFVDWGSG